MKIICIGRNYAAHAKELKNDLPTEPVIFMKPKNALLLPTKPLYYPDFTKDLHYECEVVVKLCKNGKFIQEKFAHKYYEDISLGIDFTARDVQEQQKKKGLPWEIAKAFDGSAAVGDTEDMIFSIDSIIAYVSRYFTLNIGDLIFTGTPEGVGPVRIDDKLEGYLQGTKVLEVNIR